MHTVPEATPQREALLRYNDIAIGLHWITAALVIVQLYVGFAFNDMERGPVRSDWFDWHKTLGVLILILALLRLTWRLANPPPPFPVELPRWERLAAVWNHRIFYFLLIAIPIAGLATISAGRVGSTDLIGNIPLPLIPGLTADAHGFFEDLHKAMVYLTIALAAIHVGAALKHQFIDKSRVAGRMPPFRDPIAEPVESAGEGEAE